MIKLLYGAGDPDYSIKCELQRVEYLKNLDCFVYIAICDTGETFQAPPDMFYTLFNVVISDENAHTYTKNLYAPTPEQAAREVGAELPKYHSIKCVKFA